MIPADLPLHAALVSAIEARLTTDGITAPVRVNPQQGQAWPYVTLGDILENDSLATFDRHGSDCIATISAWSDDVVEAKQVANSVCRGVTESALSLGSDHYAIGAATLIERRFLPEISPQGSIYQVVQQFRVQIGHRAIA